MLLLESILLVFNYAVSWISPLEQDFKLLEKEDQVFCWGSTGTTKERKYNFSSAVWATTSSIYQQLKSRCSPHITDGEKDFHKLKVLSWNYHEKSYLLPFGKWLCSRPLPWQDSFGKCRRNYNFKPKKMWILICFFSFFETNVGRNISGKQWDKDTISGKGIGCRKTKII